MFEATPEGVIAAGRTWIGTPYHHRARVKGAGIDCAQIMIAAFVEAGVIEDFDPGQYTHDWHQHRNEERYLSFIEEYAVEVDDIKETLEHRLRIDPEWQPRPADILMFRVGRTFSHGAIVTDWPNVLHATVPAWCALEESVLGTRMLEVPAKVFRYRGWA